MSTPAIVLSALRYGETSKIVRLATREHGVQSVIAKGALRPKSRFGAALQLLSEGQAQFILSDRRDLHTLTAFDLTHLRVGLAQDLDRYAVGSALAEVVQRFAPAAPHPDIWELLRDALALLEVAPPAAVGPLGLRVLWRAVGLLGFSPALDACARDGTPLGAGELCFSAADGGALCSACAEGREVARLAPADRADLEALLDPAADLPALAERHAAAHRRLLARYVRYHMAEGQTLPALEFWSTRPWAAR